MNKERCLNFDTCQAYTEEWENLRCEDCDHFIPDIDSVMLRFDEALMDLDIYKGKRKKDWQTPRPFYEECNDRWGPFNLDPCTTPDNPLGTEHFFTEKEDGLKQSWLLEGGTNFFMNPPYGHETVKWVAKAHGETLLHRVVGFKSSYNLVKGVALLPARTGPRWFHNYILPHYEIIFLQGRISFIDPETGKPVRGTSFDSMLVVFR